MDEKTIRKMFLSLENDFYNSVTDLAEYKDINNRMNIAEDVLINSINHEQYGLLDNLQTLQNEISSFYIQEAYVKGFTDANKMRDESLSR